MSVLGVYGFGLYMGAFYTLTRMNTNIQTYEYNKILLHLDEKNTNNSYQYDTAKYKTKLNNWNMMSPVDKILYAPPAHPTLEIHSLF